MDTRSTRQRVLGIDPGLTRMGFGVVEEGDRGLRQLAAGTIESSPDDPTAARLLLVHRRVQDLVSAWEPDAVAVERVFLKVNARTAVPAIQAAGVALVAAAGCGIPVEEYTPLEVKMAVAGTGTADKGQVRYMVERLLRQARPAGSPAPGARRHAARGSPQAAARSSSSQGAAPSPDATDALAVAICHLHARRLRALRGAAGAAR